MPSRRSQARVHRHGLHVVEALDRRLMLDAAAPPVAVGEAFIAASDTSRSERRPKVAADADGDFVAVWAQAVLVEPGRVDWYVMYRRFDDNGVPLGPDQRVTGYRSIRYPDVAMDASGDFVIAFEVEGLYNQVRAREFNADGTPRGDIIPYGPSTLQSTSPSVSMNSAGDWVMAWDAMVEPAAGARHREVDGYLRVRGGAPAPSPDDLVFVPNLLGAEVYPDVAMREDGGFVLAWEDSDAFGRSTGILARRFGPGARPEGDAERVAGSETNFERVPAVAVDDAGNAVVAWFSYPFQSSDSAVYWRRYDRSDGAWGDAVLASDGYAPEETDMALDMDDDGDFVVAASVSVPTRRLGIGIRAYNADGTAQGDPIVVFDQASEGAIEPSVALDEDGDLVVVWAGYAQPPLPRNGFDIMARRYANVGGDVRAPRVAAVSVGGTGWTSNFKTLLQGFYGGSREYGHRVPDGAAQLDVLPWATLNQISVTFDRNVTVTAADLAVRGVAVPAYTLAPAGGVPAYRYDRATWTATWTLPRPIGTDRVRLELADDVRAVANGTPALDGEWADGADAYPSGDGTPGGDFHFSFNVLPGDVNRDGRVSGADQAEVLVRWANYGADPRGDGEFSPFHDLDGNYHVDRLDVLLLRRNMGRPLPAGAPSGGAAALRGSMITRMLFGDTRVTG